MSAHPARATVWLAERDLHRGFDGAEPCVATSGRRIVALAALPPEPYDLHADALAVVMTITDTEHHDRLLRAAARGVHLVLRIDLDDKARADLVDQLSRVGSVRRLDEVSTSDARLTPTQVALLSLMGCGHSVASAAAEIGLSRRSAYRRVEEASAVLGAISPVDTVLRARQMQLLQSRAESRRRV